MAASTQVGAQSAGPRPSLGRGFAVVDPERQREVADEKAVPTKALTTFRPRPMMPSEWVRAVRSPGYEGGSCRRGR